MAKEQMDNYPRLPSTSWWQLREKFKISIPTTITPGYIAAALNIKIKSARDNVMPSLKKLGFIDDKFKPLDRIYEWRDDHNYSKVCAEVIKEIYPEELIEALPGPSPKRESVERWFASRAKVGANAATKMAKMYEVLCEADLKKGEEALNISKSTTNKLKSKTIVKSEKPLIKSDTIKKPPIVDNGNNEQDFNPSVHIDIQIHISPDSTPDQIDKIFLSMSKHIFKKKLITDEN